MNRLVIFLVAFAGGVAEAAHSNVLDVSPSDEVVIEINADTVVRTSFPDKLFGFNINYQSFQEQLWDNKDGRVYRHVIEDLRAFPSAIYRYPGGLVANAFDWTNAIGPDDRRIVQKTVFKTAPAKVRFGVDEYLSMLGEVQGSFWYVLNLVGTDPMMPMTESDEDVVAKKNRQLAQYLFVKDPEHAHYYQLGNELDRHLYEWDVRKYISRSRKTMDAIKASDKNAKFVAFLRDFTWRYKRNSSRGASRPEELMGAVLEGLPEVEDYSLHHYYSGKREDGKSRDLRFWLKLLQKSIADYRSHRGRDPNIWITEHSRQMSSSKPGKDLTVKYTSNLGGALCTADYLIAITQVPQVKGAVWHGLNAGPWQLFDASVHYNDLRPRPIYWGLRVLREMHLPHVLETHTASSNHSNNPSGYDVRAVAFADNSRRQLGIWLVNYHAEPQTVKVRYLPLSGQSVEIGHLYITGPQGRDPDDMRLKPDQVMLKEKSESTLSKEGVLILKVPPSSVSTYLISRKP